MKINNLRINKEKTKDLYEKGLFIGMISLYTIGIIEIVHTVLKTLSK